MLLELRINNLALIEQAEVHCGPGLNVLTGETGAGKSIVVQSLGLLVGERANADLVGAATGAGRASVEGAFDLADAPAAQHHLRELDIPLEELHLVVSRELSADGRSRVRLNGRLATASVLREVGALLLDLHGQHENQLLLQPGSHGLFLDAYGDARHAALLAGTAAAFNVMRQADQRLEDLVSNEQQRSQRLDMLQFQADEIDAAAPSPGQDAQLLEERSRLMNVEKLRVAAALCRDCLEGTDDAGAVSLARTALKAAREAQSLDASVEPWVDQMEGAIYSLEDAALEARNYADSLEADPARLEEVESELHRLTRLKRKYGETLERVVQYRSEIEQELQLLTSSDEAVAALRQGAESARTSFAGAATGLSESRRRLATAFAAAVAGQLESLAMAKARFLVSIESTGTGSERGIDQIEFLLSANPGQPPRPLARIASGGEISRVMLALRSVLAHTGHDMGTAAAVPILVFDEVDAGIGGVTAEAIGEKMRDLAREFQVFCVTHLPQIARHADRHYRVLKESGDSSTTVSVTLLQGEDRVHELARMMGRSSEANLRHAREILR